MPRNKTFRKRNPKKIQKGGAFDMTVLSFPKINSTKTTKYYAYVVKTLKAGGGGRGGSSSSSGSSGIGGGGIGGPGMSGMSGHDIYSLQQQPQIVAVTTSLPENEYEYKTTIIDEEQKNEICADTSNEKAKIIKGAGAAGNLKQFVEKNTGDEVITIFELNDGNSTTLNGLTITKENVKWNDFVVC